MSLIVDFRNCAEETRKQLNRYQFEIGTYMMAIGMSKITEDNCLEVYARIRMLQASTLCNDEPWMNLDVCKALIGAEFNISEESKAKFSTRMLKCTLKELGIREAQKTEEVA